MFNFESDTDNLEDTHTNIHTRLPSLTLQTPHRGKVTLQKTEVCSETVVHFLLETPELGLPGKLFHSEFSLTSKGAEYTP